MTHPWTEAAEAVGSPFPVPTTANMELVSVGQGDERATMVLVLTATPAGVTTVFMDVPMFMEFMEAGRSIISEINEKEKEDHPLINIKPATQTDMRNAVRGLILLHDNTGGEKK